MNQSSSRRRGGGARTSASLQGHREPAGGAGGRRAGTGVRVEPLARLVDGCHAPILAFRLKRVNQDAGCGPSACAIHFETCHYWQTQFPRGRCTNDGHHPRPAIRAPSRRARNRRGGPSAVLEDDRAGRMAADRVPARDRARRHPLDRLAHRVAGVGAGPLARHGPGIPRARRSAREGVRHGERRYRDRVRVERGRGRGGGPAAPERLVGTPRRRRLAGGPRVGRPAPGPRAPKLPGRRQRRARAACTPPRTGCTRPRSTARGSATTPSPPVGRSIASGSGTTPTT